MADQPGPRIYFSRCIAEPFGASRNLSQCGVTELLEVMIQLIAHLPKKTAGAIAPFAVDVAFEVAFIRERLLNFLVARRVRVRWVGGTTPFSPSYAAAGGGALV